MARCPGCQESLPFAVPLKNLLRSRRDRRAQVFTCPACGQEGTLSLVAQLFSVVFIVVVGATVSMALLMCPWISEQPWFSPGAIGVLILLSVFISYYLWWKFIANVQVK